MKSARMAEKETYDFERFFSLFPVHIYMIDANGYYQSCNELQAIDFGLKTKEDVRNKKNADIPIFKNHDDIIKILDDNNNLVFSSKKPFEFIEPYIKANGTFGQTKSHKIPIFQQNQLIGLIGISIDISNEAEKLDALELQKKQKHFEFTTIIDNLPEHIYWLNRSNIFLGCNIKQANDFGLKKSSELIGLHVSSFQTSENAQKIIKINNTIMDSGQPMTVEENFLNKSGENVYYLSKKLPLKNSTNEVYGILGVSIDITDRKKIEEELKNAKDQAESTLQALQQAQLEEEKLRITAEKLEIENVIHKAQIDAQAEFSRMVAQVVHDITSPITSLRTILQECSELPEKKRIDLRRAAERILDITNNLLNQYRPVEEAEANKDEIKQPALLSETLIELLSEKKYEYHNMPLELISEFSPSSQFAFVNVQLSALKRAISNLINNAVQALDSTSGKVYLKLDANNEWVHISVQDNGKGMNQETIDKIKNKIAFTEGKMEGHGIGLTQIMDTLERNFASLDIKSELEKGSVFTLTFPRLNTPIWCAEKITIKPDSIIIVLDDDPSIHGAWDVRFEGVLLKSPRIRLHHFEVGQEALAFIQSLNAEDKRSLIVLTDYELLNQSLNGLDLVKAAHPIHAILVTSHYMNPDIRNQAALLNIRVLPKQLAGHIPIVVVDSEKQYTGGSLRVVDAVWLDDDQEFTFRYEKKLIENKKKVDMYRTPKELMDNIHLYPKDTPIFLDNNFQEPFSDIAGTEIAKQLYERGFTKLFLITGNRLNQNDFSFVKILAKRDVESLLGYLE